MDTALVVTDSTHMENEMHKEKLGVTGTLELTVLHEDGSKTVRTIKNLITLNGLVILANLLANTIPSGIVETSVGYGTTEPDEGDASLSFPYLTLATVLVTKLTGADAMKVEYFSQWELGAIVGDVAEAGLFTTTQMFNRAVFTAVPLTATDLLITKWTIEFKNL